MAQQEYRVMHIFGSLTIDGIPYTFDNQMKVGDRLDFSNGGCDYHISLLSNPLNAIGLWLDAYSGPTVIFEVLLLVESIDTQLSAAILDASSDILSGTKVDLCIGGVVFYPNEVLAGSPWNSSSYEITGKGAFTQFGLDANIETFSTGLLIGFVPQVPTSLYVIHQSPITILSH